MIFNGKQLNDLRAFRSIFHVKHWAMPDKIKVSLKDILL